MNCRCDSRNLQWVGHDFDCEYMMLKRGSRVVDMPLYRLVYDDDIHISDAWVENVRESILAVGLINPIKVKKCGDRYEVTNGRVRVRVYEELEKETIEAEICK